MKFKFSILLAVLLLILSACGSEANSDSSGNSNEGSATDYPERDIEILVGHGAGGGTDSFTRAVAKELEEILGVNVNVVNQEGGAGVVAIQNAYNAPADGHTLVGISAFPITTAAGTNQYGLDAFTPIARFQSDTYALWVNPEKYESIDEFVQAAKDNPGEISVGGTGSLGMDEITAFTFGQEAGVELNFIPQNGSGEMHAGVIGGHLDAMFDEFGPTQSLYEEGDIKPLVVFSEERLEDFPDVPTTVENGWDLTDGNERGFMIKSETDPEIIAALEDAMKQAYETDSYQEYEENNYLHLREGWMNSEEYTTRLEESITKFEEILAELQK
ncbi:tripartite tricarboxylate transporter substrate binding protein [Oceanobacillus kapialis]|uniref:tripartite tricarboxylate transporter substrate binding protein n=1 Tax=Oceanobacillus kapialis TaxID=481353 RepID=UPI0038511350